MSRSICPIGASGTWLRDRTWPRTRSWRSHLSGSLQNAAVMRSGTINPFYEPSVLSCYVVGRLCDKLYQIEKRLISFSCSKSEQVSAPSERIRGPMIICASSWPLLGGNSFYKMDCWKMYDHQLSIRLVGFESPDLLSKGAQLKWGDWHLKIFYRVTCMFSNQTLLIYIYRWVGKVSSWW